MSNLLEEYSESLYNDGLAKKVYLEDSEASPLIENGLDRLPKGTFYEEVKDGGDIAIRLFRYQILSGVKEDMGLILLRRIKIATRLLWGVLAGVIAAVIMLIILCIQI